MGTGTNFTAASDICSAYGSRLCLPFEVVQGEAILQYESTCATGGYPIWTAQSCGANSHVVADYGAGWSGSTCESDTASRTWACCADAQDSYGDTLTAYFNDASIYTQSAGTISVTGPT